MKKFYVRDEDGKNFEVEEVETTTTPADEIPAEEPPVQDANSLSDEEILSLKRLASVSDKLIALVETTDSNKEEEEDVTDSDEDEDEEDITDSDEDEDEDEAGEQVIDTDEDEVPMKKDSKKSFGSIEKKKTAKDSAIDSELEIANAWAKRYGGNK